MQLLFSILLGTTRPLNKVECKVDVPFAIAMPRLTVEKVVAERSSYRASWLYSSGEVKLSGVFMDEVVKAVVLNSLKFPVTVSFYKKCTEDVPEIECEENLRDTLPPRSLERGTLIRIVPTEHFMIKFNFQDCKATSCNY